MKVALPIPIRYLVNLLQQLALVLRVVRHLVAAGRELVPGAAQVEVGVVDAPYVPRYLLESQVDLLFVAYQVVPEVVDF